MSLATRARARFLALEQERCFQLLQQDFLFVSTKTEEGIQISLESQDRNVFKNQTFLTEKQRRQLQMRRDSKDDDNESFQLGRFFLRFQTTCESTWLVCLFYVFSQLWHDSLFFLRNNRRNLIFTLRTVRSISKIEFCQLEDKKDKEFFSWNMFSHDFKRNANLLDSYSCLLFVSDCDTIFFFLRKYGRNLIFNWQLGRKRRPTVGSISPYALTPIELKNLPSTRTSSIKQIESMLHGS